MTSGMFGQGESNYLHVVSCDNFTWCYCIDSSLSIFLLDACLMVFEN